VACKWSGSPSNQFLQELRSNEKIREYCATTWGISFPIFDRVRVNGRNEHPLYTELKKTPDAAGKAGKVTWNFEKFLVTPSGDVMRFRPHTVPDDPMIIAAIEQSLPA
jgi:glutathione peroxidase